MFIQPFCEETASKQTRYLVGKKNAQNLLLPASLPLQTAASTAANSSLLACCCHTAWPREWEMPSGILQRDTLPKQLHCLAIYCPFAALCHFYLPSLIWIQLSATLKYFLKYLPCAPSCSKPPKQVQGSWEMNSLLPQVPGLPRSNGTSQGGALSSGMCLTQALSHCQAASRYS